MIGEEVEFRPCWSSELYQGVVKDLVKGSVEIDVVSPSSLSRSLYVPKHFMEDKL